MGIITSADVVELVDDEMGDDYAKLGGLTSEEDLNEGVFQSVKKRLPWLCLLYTYMEEVKELAKANTGYIKTMWCGDLACEMKMKEEEMCIRDRS